ncbi:MAG TPA: hypothetical protein DD670_04725 [Planctomycetaceae bacterium]|nr:hypothetical protein [Planctomycetaceae bacterium]
MQATRIIASLLRWLGIVALALLAVTIFALLPFVTKLPSREDGSAGEHRFVLSRIQTQMIAFDSKPCVATSQAVDASCRSANR